jgi:hypothetical protein
MSAVKLTTDAPVGGSLRPAPADPLSAPELKRQDGWYYLPSSPAYLGKTVESSPQPAEEKKQPSPPRPRARLVGRMGQNRSDSKVASARMCYSFSFTSGAAAAQTPVLACSPSASPDWAAWASLYDECRVTHAKVRYHVSTSAGTGTLGSDLVAAFDPIEGSALASISNGCVYERHTLTRVGGSTTTNAPFDNSKSFWTLQSPVRSDGARNVTSTAIASGWMSTTDPTDIFGYMKWYIAAATGTTTVDGYCTLRVDFRSRQ